MLQWTWVSAEYRGTSHERTGAPMQDAHSCFVAHNERDIFVSVVADGAGSASFGGQGASLACRLLANAVRAHFRVQVSLPSDSDIESWVDVARDQVFSVAIRRSLQPREFASTLIFAMTDGENTVIAHIGDGCCVLQDRATGQWLTPSWPDHGEYASTTHFLTDEPTIALRITRYSAPISAMVSFTDGLERLALDFAAARPFDRFLNGICLPLFKSRAQGRDRKLSEQLREYLNSQQINGRTDDDKTLILAVPR